VRAMAPAMTRCHDRVVCLIVILVCRLCRFLCEDCVLLSEDYKLSLILCLIV
jgi:hypothetical protein